MKRLILLVLALLAAVPLAAQDTMPPAPYAYKQLEDPALEAKAQECRSSVVADVRSQIEARMARAGGAAVKFASAR